MKKRIILLTVAMLLIITSALAQGGTTGPLTWIIENNTLTISGEGEMPDYYSVGAPWLAYSTSIHTVVIETGVTTIGNSAFLGFSPDYINLTSVTIPNTVITIGRRVFAYCANLTSITIPENVTTIGERAFLSCISLPSIIIPNSVTTIGEWAFANCFGLTSVTLSNNITDIEFGTFSHCESLTSITIPSGVTTIGRQTFGRCHSLTSVTIPSSVTTIGMHAFSECTSLPSITIPSSVTTIGNGVFQLCFNLASVTLSNSLTAIENFTFCYCENLTSITIPNSVTKIGDSAFGDCIRLTSINIPENVTTIGNSTFFRCLSLTSITIPASVTKIGESAFTACTSLTSIEVESANNYYSSTEGVLFNKDKTTLISYPAGKTKASYIISKNVTKVENGAFFGCENLTAIEVENGSDSFISENGVLFNKDKTTLVCYPIGKTETSYIIPNSVTTVGIGAFYFSPNLTSVIIPNSVTRLREQSFSDCTALTSIILPKSVRNIEDFAFYDCENLTLITCLSLVPATTSTYAFFGFNQKACTLKVPTSAVPTYQKANRWKEFGNIIGGGLLVNPVSNNIKYGYTTGDGLYEAGETATITATARDGYKFLRWTKKGAEVSTENSYTFTVTEDVELVAHFEAEVGIGELQVTSYELQVYPNPTRGEIQVTSYELQVTGIEVFDVFGRNVGVKFPSFGGVRGGNIAHLPNGIYILRIQTENEVIVRKVVKN